MSAVSFGGRLASYFRNKNTLCCIMPMTTQYNKYNTKSTVRPPLAVTNNSNRNTAQNVYLLNLNLIHHNPSSTTTRCHSTSAANATARRMRGKPRNVHEVRSTVLLSLPRSISEAETIVNHYLSANELVLFMDIQCPFCAKTMEFLDCLQLDYEAIDLSSFGNRQLIQNYLQLLCDSKESARFPPILFVRQNQNSEHSSRNTENTENVENAEIAKNANGLYMVGADGVANAWQTQALHAFYPHLIQPSQSPSSSPSAAEAEQWRQITVLLQSMSHSFGYTPGSMSSSSYFKSIEMDEQQLKANKVKVGTPILTAEIGQNPHRPN